jgi:hypothetical protein
MGHRKLSPDFNGKLRLAGSFLGIAVFLISFYLLPPTYYTQLLVYHPTATYNVSGADPPSLIIFARGPLSPDDDDPCALRDVRSDFGNILLPTRAALESPSPAVSFSFNDPIPLISRLKRLVSTPRSPPSSL